MSRLFTLILFVALGLNSQGQNRSTVDSVLAVPYDQMVADLQRSKKTLSSALLDADKLSNKESLAEISSRLNVVTYLLGEYETSLEHGQRSIKLFEDLKLRSKAGASYCALGYQIKRRDMQKANEYMRAGMQILEAIPDSGELEAAYNNYGVIKEMENVLDSAMHYYLLSYELVKRRNDSISLPFNLNNLAGIELLRKNFYEADSLFKQSYDIRKKRGDSFGVLENTMLFGDLFKAQSKWDSAIHYYNSAVKLSYEVNYPYMRQHCYQMLAEVYEEKGDLRMAIRSQKDFSLLKDSLQAQQRTGQLAEMEIRFETAQKEKENLLLKQETQEQQLVVSRQRNWIFGLLGLAFTIVFLSLFIVQRHRTTEAAKRDAAIIAERERGLRAIILATEEERKRIAKDLHDGIVQSLTGLSLKIQKTSSSLKAKATGLNKDLNETRSTLDEAIAEVRGISHQMMPRVLSESGLIPALDDMLAKSLGMAEIGYVFEHHNTEKERFEETVEISLYRIAQELVNNIIKHAGANAVSIQLIKTRSHLVLIVEDNGTGFKYEDEKNRNGIGLMNISSRVKAINGEVNYEPSPKQGTVASIRVPLG